MKIELSPGDSILVGFTDTDGEFEIHFDSPTFPMAIAIKEAASLSGNRIGEADAVLYLEDFSKTPEEEGLIPIEEDTRPEAELQSHTPPVERHPPKG